MKKTLYVYDSQNLEKMKQSLVDYSFSSLTNLIHKYNELSDIQHLESNQIQNQVFDITNIVLSEFYYRPFIERYLLTIADYEFENVFFCIQKKYLVILEEKFPFLFDEEEIDYLFTYQEEKSDTSTEKTEIKIYPPIELFVYEKIETINRMKTNKETISLSTILNAYNDETLNFNLNIKEISLEKTIKYVDITSIIKMLIIRKDLIVQFEIFFYQLFLHNDIKYCVFKDVLEDTLLSFPLTFIEKQSLDNEIISEERYKEEISNLDIKRTTLSLEKINAELKGHFLFKEDFKQNLIRFSFFNKMKKRKILSVFLCGASGIGKTEFAKITSRSLYEGENLIKINFGNYSTEGVLNSLIGSPLGYIGSEKGGELINKISESKSKVILIDEFERATPSVYNFFYELLEDGAFTDRQGIEHDLDGYIIVFTSNMTEEYYQKKIPDSLKSRFDMVYNFEDLDIIEKKEYIHQITLELIEDLNKEFGTSLNMTVIARKLDGLEMMVNLRNIKRKVEEIVFDEFYREYTIN